MNFEGNFAEVTFQSLVSLTDFASLCMSARFLTRVTVIVSGISTLAKTPTRASDYLHPLLSFAAAHVPKTKHKETPLYILCTAGMRLLPDRWEEQRVMSPLMLRSILSCAQPLVL